VLGAGVSLLASCASISTAAGDVFASQTQCAREKVTVVRRPDYRRPLPPAPLLPPDVAADPARLAVWQQQRDEERRQANESACGPNLPGYDAYEATGCGLRFIVCCANRYISGGEGTTYSQVIDCQSLVRLTLPR
jgi:hypothetical protein